MGLPIGVALFGIGIGTSIIVGLSHLFTVPETAQFIGIMIGLGVGIDYALLIVTRYREQLHAGHTVARVGRPSPWTPRVARCCSPAPPWSSRCSACSSSG